MRVDPNLSYQTFKQATPLVPADIRPMLFEPWRMGRVLEVKRLMAHWGMSAEDVGETVRSLAVTCLVRRRKRRKVT